MLKQRYAARKPHVGDIMRPFAFPVLCVCVILNVPVCASAQTSRSCAPSAIRAAAAKQVAPNLVGCRYDEVAVPLVRYFSIFPALTKTPGGKANSTILEQTPAAGEALAAGGQLALNVSVGPSLKPEEATGVAPMETPPVAVAEAVQPQQADVASASSVSEAPIEITEFVAAAEPPAAPAVMPRIQLPSLAYLLRPGLLWALLGIVVFGIGIIMTFRGKKTRPEYGYERVPKVMARLEYGPGRLSANGPLIVGREGGQ
jgi:hypothetical protein